MRPARLAFTLIELLSCVAILTILSGIACYCYASAVERAAVKLALPFLAADLGRYVYEATHDKAVITVNFPEGQDYLLVVKRGPKGGTHDKIGLLRGQSLGRRLWFKKYTWPDGKEAPRTFTFLPRESPRGGTVCLGTHMAEGRLMIAGNGIKWE